MGRTPSCDESRMSAVRRRKRMMTGLRSGSWPEECAQKILHIRRYTVLIKAYICLLHNAKHEASAIRAVVPYSAQTKWSPYGLDSWNALLASCAETGSTEFQCMPVGLSGRNEHWRRKSIAEKRLEHSRYGLKEMICAELRCLAPQTSMIPRLLMRAKSRRDQRRPDEPLGLQTQSTRALLGEAAVPFCLLPIQLV